MPLPVRRISAWAPPVCRMAGAVKWQRFDYCGARPLDESLYLLVRGFSRPRACAGSSAPPESAVGDSLDRSFEASAFCENGVPQSAVFITIEMKRYLHDQLLRIRRVQHGAFNELRVPLLDHLLVEAGWRARARLANHPGINNRAGRG